MIILTISVVPVFENSPGKIFKFQGKHSPVQKIKRDTGSNKTRNQGSRAHLQFIIRKKLAVMLWILHIDSVVIESYSGLERDSATKRRVKWIPQLSDTAPGKGKQGYIGFINSPSLRLSLWLFIATLDDRELRQLSAWGSSPHLRELCEI